jgi:hypothetical protein
MTGQRMTRWLAVLACILAAPCGQATAAERLVLSGEPTALISDEQRVQLGLKFGPDAPVDFFQAKDGQYYINSAGSLGAPDGPGRMAAWNLHVDPLLTRVLALHGNSPATGPQDVQAILTDYAAECGKGRRRLTEADPGGAACASYFDRDYAGGGAYFRCPDNTTSVYFYHGENHTAPDGSAGHGGWFGLGVGVFNPGETAVARVKQMPVSGGRPSAQIIGMDVGTVWTEAGRATRTPPQANPYNGVPSVAPGPDGTLLLFHGNATFDPEYNPSACRPECMSASRVPVGAFCTAMRSGDPSPAWQNFFHGGWGAPALLSPASPKGAGAGGDFTPIAAPSLPGEYGGTVTYLASRHLYLMTRLSRGGINLRTSLDGLAWSAPQQLVDAPTGTTPDGDAERIVYPKIAVVQPGTPHEGYVLTYVLATKGHMWRWAELMRQALTLG